MVMYPHKKIRRKVIILSIFFNITYIGLYVLDRKIKTMRSYAANDHFLESQ